MSAYSPYACGEYRIQSVNKKRSRIVIRILAALLLEFTRLAFGEVLR